MKTSHAVTHGQKQIVKWKNYREYKSSILNYLLHQNEQNSLFIYIYLFFHSICVNKHHKFCAKNICFQINLEKITILWKQTNVKHVNVAHLVISEENPINLGYTICNNEKKIPKKIF